MHPPVSKHALLQSKLTGHVTPNVTAKEAVHFNVDSSDFFTPFDLFLGTRCQQSLLLKIPILVPTGPEMRGDGRSRLMSHLNLSRSEEQEPLGKPKNLLAALRCHFS